MEMERTKKGWKEGGREGGREGRLTGPCGLSGGRRSRSRRKGGIG